MKVYREETSQGLRFNYQKIFVFGSVILIFILSCNDKMSNEDIIKEVVKCREAKMGYKLLHENVGAVITSVQ